MNNEENLVVTLFLNSYISLSDMITTSSSWLDQIRMTNITLQALLNARDYLDKIDKAYIHNTILIAMAIEKNYKGRGTPEIKDLSKYLQELSKLSITKDRFSQKSY